MPTTLPMSGHRESDNVGPVRSSLLRHHPHYQQHFPLVQVQEQDPLQWHDHAVSEGRDHRGCSVLVCQKYLPAETGRIWRDCRVAYSWRKVIFLNLHISASVTIIYLIRGPIFRILLNVLLL